MLTDMMKINLKFGKGVLLLIFHSFILMNTIILKADYSKTVTVLKKTSSIIELTINKATTDEQLSNIKKDLAKRGYDFAYTITRNKKNQIKSLFIKITGGNQISGEVTSSYTSASDNDTIVTTYVSINTELNKIKIGNSDIRSNKLLVNGKVILNNEESNSKTIMIKEINGKKEVSINGSIVSKDKLEQLDNEINSNAFVFIENSNQEEGTETKIKSGTEKQILIKTGRKEEQDVKITEKEGSGFFFVKTDEGKSPLFYINGKESDNLTIKKLNPNTIATINVLKGAAAMKKYGKKAKDGAIEITLK